MVIGGVILTIYFGYLEDKFGFYSGEQDVVTRRNPRVNEILKSLDRIEKKLEHEGLCGKID